MAYFKEVLFIITKKIGIMFFIVVKGVKDLRI